MLRSHIVTLRVTIASIEQCFKAYIAVLTARAFLTRNTLALTHTHHTHTHTPTTKILAINKAFQVSRPRWPAAARTLHTRSRSSQLARMCRRYFTVCKWRATGDSCVGQQPTRAHLCDSVRAGGPCPDPQPDAARPVTACPACRAFLDLPDELAEEERQLGADEARAFYRRVRRERLGIPTVADMGPARAASGCRPGSGRRAWARWA